MSPTRSPRARPASPSPAQGDGYLAAFDEQGHFLAQYDTGTSLNAPWGITQADPGSGPYAGDILVANTGDGTIQAFTPVVSLSAPIAPPGPNGTYVGPVLAADGSALTIPGLWGLATPQDSNGPLAAPGTVDYTERRPVCKRRAGRDQPRHRPDHRRHA